MRVCVIGAGLAGMACALAAANAGATVEVFDAATEMAAVPAHMVVVPNMLRDLVALGVGEACVRAGFPYQGTDVVDSRGHHQFELKFSPLAGKRYPVALGIVYRDLSAILARAATQHGVQWHWNARLTADDLHWQAGRLCVGNGGAAGLVVLATGAGDPLSRAVFSQERHRIDFGREWWYALVPRPPELDRAVMALGSARQKAIVVPANLEMAGLTISRVAADRLAGAPLVGRAAQLRESLNEYPDVVSLLSRSVRDDTPVVVRAERAELLAAPWHKGNVVCVGECAAEFPPHFGQAAAQAVESAAVLMELLAASSEPTVIAANLAQRRQARAETVFELTTQAARWDVAPEPSTDMRALVARLDQAVSIPA